MILMREAMARLAPQNIAGAPLDVRRYIVRVVQFVFFGQQESPAFRHHVCMLLPTACCVLPDGSQESV